MNDARKNLCLRSGVWAPIHGAVPLSKNPVLSELYAYFLENEEQLHQQLMKMQMLGNNHDRQSKDRTVCDLIASMTDRYAMSLYQKIFFPSPVV